jgi:hypothetical protein
VQARYTDDKVWWILSYPDSVFLKRIGSAPFDLRDALRAVNNSVPLRLGPVFDTTNTDDLTRVSAFNDFDYWYFISDRGYRDCPAGCINAEFRHYRVDRQGDVCTRHYFAYGDIPGIQNPGSTPSTPQWDCPSAAASHDRLSAPQGRQKPIVSLHNNTMTVHLQENHPNSPVTLYSANGTVVVSQPIDSRRGSFHLPADLPSGLYFLRAPVNNGYSSLRILVP